MPTEQELETYAKSAWPHVDRVSVDRIVPGRRKPSEFEPMESGFTLTAYGATGDILKRISATTLGAMHDKIEQQLKKNSKLTAKT
jgi:hypothetical protein